MPSPGDLPDPGIKLSFPATLTLQEDSLPLSHWEANSMEVSQRNKVEERGSTYAKAGSSLRSPPEKKKKKTQSRTTM